MAKSCIFHELIELSRDEEISVRTASLETLVDLLDFFDKSKPSSSTYFAKRLLNTNQANYGWHAPGHFYVDICVCPSRGHQQFVCGVICTLYDWLYNLCCSIYGPFC